MLHLLGHAAMGLALSLQPPAAAPPRASDAAAVLHILLDEHYQQAMEDSPTTASLRGDDRYNDRLLDMSPQGIARQRARYRSRLDRLDGIDRASLADGDLLNASLLRLELELALESARFFPEQMPLDNLDGPNYTLPQMADSLRFATDKHFADYTARLEAIPRLLDQYTVQMRAGLAAGRVPPSVAVSRTAEQAFGLSKAEVVTDPTTSPFYKPFLVRNPEDPIAARARKAISSGVAPAFAAFGAFLRDEYIPKCRQSIAAADGLDGKAWYEFQVRRHTTTRLTAEEIHRIGLDEVARIRAEMFRVIARTDFPGGKGLSGDDLFKAFTNYLRTDPRFYCTSEADLVRGYRDIAKRIDGELPALFGRLPRNPYGVRVMLRFVAESSPTAYYYPGSLRSGVAGYFMVNSYRLDQRPRYEMTALTLHEAVPGHHLQYMLADELEGTHPFRSLAAYTVFVEGWALYAERLGLEMAGAPRRLESEGKDGGTGLFTDPYDDFGRLSYEMWRACRLVVDPGIHAMGWSRQKAVEFMLANSALSPLNIEREVDRYIAWPGQAVAYKIGELRIRAMRVKAEQALGDRLDLRAFHDALLGAGAIPIEVLQERIDRWIAGVKSTPVAPAR